jgi:very-short-patch-repair endonuclease
VRDFGSAMPDRLTRTARLLRRHQTEDERRLWARLRDRRLNGLKFRRQAPCGPYIADFLCEAARLIVELDGSHHAEPAAVEADLARTRDLKALGYKVFRVWNADLKTNMDGVLDQIVALAEGRISPSSAPPGHLLPEGEGSGPATTLLSSPGTGEDARLAEGSPSARRAGEGLLERNDE